MDEVIEIENLPEMDPMVSLESPEEEDTENEEEDSENEDEGEEMSRNRRRILNILNCLKMLIPNRLKKLIPKFGIKAILAFISMTLVSFFDEGTDINAANQHFK